MLFVVFVIAVLNLCFGFVLAVQLGYGPPSLSAAWQVLGGGGRLRLAATRQASSRRPTENAAANSDAPDMSALNFDDEDLDNFLDMDQGDDFRDDAMVDEPRGDDEINEDSAAADDAAPAAASNPNAPENWLLDDKYIETSVLKLNIAMMKSGARAANLDSRLRVCREHADAGALREIAGLLGEDCETYLAEQAEAAEKLRLRLGEFGDLASVAEEIEMGNMQQAAQIETTLSNLAQLDFDADADAAIARLLEELGKLREARHKLRDGQELAFFTIALRENRVENIPKQVFNDELTGLRSRVGLEATLRDWWAVCKHKKHQMSAALFDLDRFGLINSRHSPAVADATLKEIANILKERCATGDLLGRFAGQRFLFVAVDKGPRAAIKDAEFMRQSVARAAFECAGGQFNLSICGGCTEITKDDTVETLQSRLAAALAAAKAAGPDHGCFHDGRETQIVDSPNLGAKYRDVKLDNPAAFPENDKNTT